MTTLEQITDIPVIDAHVHAFPPKLTEAIERWFLDHAWTFHTSGTLIDRLDEYYRSGLAGSVMLAYAHRPGIARGVNEHTAALVGRFPNAAGLAAVHPLDDDPKAVIDHALDELGLKGVKLHCHVLKTAPDDPSLDPIYKAVLDHDALAVVHAGKEPAIEAYGCDVRAITGADRVEKVLRRFPGLKLVVPHLGFDETDAFHRLMDRHPNLYLDTTMLLANFFPVRIDREGLIRYADRILYGTDFPHIPYPVEREAKALIDLDLGPEATRKIFRDNACRLYGLD